MPSFRHRSVPRRRVAAALAALAAVVLQGVAPAPAAPASRRVALLSDPVFRNAADRGLDRLYDMDFAAADHEFAVIAARHPGHPVGPFLAALATWWRIQLDPADPSRDAAFLAAMDEVIAASDRRLARDAADPDGRFFKGAALAFRGRLRSLRGDLLPAALDCKRALGLVRQVAAADPGDVDLTFGMGMYDYFGDVLPERYPLLRPLAVFLPPADRGRGLDELAAITRDGHFVRTEAAWFLLQIQMFVEEDYGQTRRWVGWLRRAHPHNSLFHELEGRMYLKWGDTRRARAVFTDILAHAREGAPGYTVAQSERALYSLAVCDMREGRYRTALALLVRQERVSAAAPGERPLQVLGRLRQGMVYDVLGHRETAVRRYRQVLAMEDVAAAHHTARRLLREPYRVEAQDAEPAS